MSIFAPSSLLHKSGTPVLKLLALFVTILIGMMFVSTSTTHAEGEVFYWSDTGSILGTGGGFAEDVVFAYDGVHDGKQWYRPRGDFQARAQCGDNDPITRTVETTTTFPRIERDPDSSNKTTRFLMSGIRSPCARGQAGGWMLATNTMSVVNAETAEESCRAQQKLWQNGVCTGNPNPTTPDEEETTENHEQAGDILCAGVDIQMRWIICPLTTLLSAALTGAENLVTQLLETDVELFDNEGYQNTWAAFRTLALALILIAGLIIVIAQASGLQVLDAYTIKKAVPRLVLAVIFITLSWPLLELIITITNDVARLLEGFILTPFTNVEREAGESVRTAVLNWAAIGGIVTFFGSLVALITASGGIILSFLGTAAAVIFIALIVIGIRAVLITVCVILAPIAIACSILPATEKAYGLWRTTLISCLLVYPMIILLITFGKIGAILSTDPILSIVLYLAPFFMIPFAFRLAGGIMGKLAGLANDSSRGFFDKGRKFRQEQHALNKDDAVGERGPLANTALGGLWRRQHYRREGGFNPGRQGEYQAAIRAGMTESIAKRMDSSAGKAAGGNDDANKLLWQDGMTEKKFVDQYTKTKDYRTGLNYTEAQAKQALGVFEAGSGARVGTRAARAFAGAAVLSSNTSMESEEMEDNAAYEAQVAGSLIRDGILSSSETTAFTMKASGRADRVSAGFGQTMKFHDTAASPTGVSTKDVTEHVNKNVTGANAGAVLFGNSRGAKAAAPKMAELVRDAAAGSDDKEFIKQLAWGANQYDNLSRTSPDIADVFAEGYMSQEVEYGGVTKSIREHIEDHRNDPRFLDRRKEWGTATAARAAMDAGGDPGAPPVGPPPTP